MLVHFDPPLICLYDGGSICLVPRIRSTGIFDPGIDSLVPRTALGGPNPTWHRADEWASDWEASQEFRGVLTLTLIRGFQ